MMVALGDVLLHHAGPENTARARDVTLSRSFNGAFDRGARGEPVSHNTDQSGSTRGKLGRSDDVICSGIINGP